MKIALYFVLSLPLISQAKALTVKDFCERPVEVICGPPLQKKQKRDQRLEERKWQIKEKAVAYVLQKKPDALISELEFDDEEHPEGKLNPRQQRIAQLYFEGIYNELQKVIGKSYSNFKPAFTKVKDFLVRMIHQRIKTARPEDASRMLKILSPEKIEFVDALEMLQKAPQKDAELLNHIVESCGKDGLEDNDFAVEVNGRNYIVACPGDYLALWDPELKTGVSSLEMWGAYWTLGHEIGHPVDANNFPASYEKFETCVEEQYGDELAGENLSDYMGEISADYWATESLVEILASLKSDEQRLYVLQDNLESLCGSTDDHVHPDGRFRIENFVRRNPRLSRVLGCKADPSREWKKSCTLRGAWDKERFW